MPDDELHVGELPDDGIELRRDRIGPITGVDQHHDTQLVAFAHHRTQPVQGPVRAVGMHVGVQLQHLEAVLADMELQLGGPVVGPETRVVVEVPDEPIRVPLGQLSHISHVVADPLPARPPAVTPRRVPRRGLDETHIDTPRLAVDPIRPIHHGQHPLTRERLAGMTPSLINHVGRMQMGVDDHAGSSLPMRSDGRTGARRRAKPVGLRSCGPRAASPRHSAEGSPPAGLDPGSCR